MNAHLAVLHLRTQRPHAPAFQQSLDRLNAAAVRVATAQGWRVEQVASSEVPSEVTLAAVDRADAVVVMGGEDVHPEFYAGALEYPGSGHHEPAADRAHIAAVHACLEAGTPLLGLCRGLQVLNVALGGTLVQHLPSGHLHRAAAEDPFVPHRITLLGEHLVDTVDQGREVRCSHHQAVDRLGEGLVVAARAEDGVVEAVVHVEAPITAVQWHPEHPDLADDQLAPLLARLGRQVPHPRSTCRSPDSR